MKPFVRFMAVAAAMLFVSVACGAQALTSVAPNLESPSSSASRPILHSTAVGTSWGVVAVDLSGKRTSTNAGWGFAWSPDGSAHASFDNNHRTLYLVSGSGVRQDVWTAGSAEQISYWPPVTWNPDGRRVAVATENDVMSVSDRRHWLVVIDVVRKAEVARIELPWQLFDSHDTFDPPRNSAWSPDGKKLLLNWIWTAVVDPSTSSTGMVTTTQSVANWAGPNSVDYITIGDGPSLTGLYQWDGLTGKTKPLASAEDMAQAGLYPSPTSLLGHLLVRRSPDGSRLAVVSWKNSGHQLGDGTTIRIFSLPIDSASSLKAPLVTRDTGLIVMSADWSPDGRQIAYLGFDGGQSASGWSEVRGRVDVLDVGAGTTKTIDEVRFQSEIADVDLFAWHSLSWSS